MTNTYSVALGAEHQSPISTFTFPVLHFGHRRARTDSYEEVVCLQERHPVLTVLSLLLAGPAMLLAVAAFAAAIVTPVALLCGWL